MPPNNSVLLLVNSEEGCGKVKGVEVGVEVGEDLAVFAGGCSVLALFPPNILNPLPPPGLFTFPKTFPVGDSDDLPNMNGEPTGGEVGVVDPTLSPET